MRSVIKENKDIKLEYQKKMRPSYKREDKDSKIK